MDNRQLFLYAFFTRLRKEMGMELDMQQYFGFLKSFTSGIPLETPGDLLELCKINWLTRPRFEAGFERLFQEEFANSVRLAGLKDRKAIEQEIEKSPASAPRAEDAPLPPPPPPPKMPEKEIAPEPTGEDAFQSIYLNFSEGESAGAGSKPAGDSSASFLDNDFLFSDKYLPASDRRLKQNWRYLRSRAEKSPGTDLDIPLIVRSIAQRGFFHQPFFLPEKTYRLHILFLIDHGGSMTAFETLTEHLIATIRESLQVKHATSLYFHNYPGERLFQDPYHTQSIRLPELLRDMPRHGGLAFVISDAGAARGRVHEERIAQTIAFLHQIRSRIPRVLWLNPAPAGRWQGSSAGYLSFHVDMVEASEAGFRKLPEKLKHL